MQIASSQIIARSQHLFERAEQRVTVLQNRPESAAPAPMPDTETQPPAPPAAPSFRIALPDRNAPAPAESEPPIEGEYSLLKALVEALTGRKIDALDVPGDGSATAAVSAPPAASNEVLRLEAVHISEYEYSEVGFSAELTTAGGASFSLDLHFAMERSYEETSFTATLLNRPLTDPVALNFDGRGARPTLERVEFDLNSDGSAEWIPGLAEGSAYLALDRDGDGRIGSGAKLFGPTSGDGFAELAALDADGNGFLDAADPSFAQLLLYRPGEQGSRSLTDLGVGAIFLGAIASPFRYTDQSNQTLGQLRATSFYLTNTGRAGLAQQLDLTA